MSYKKAFARFLLVRLAAHVYVIWGNDYSKVLSYYQRQV